MILQQLLQEIAPKVYCVQECGWYHTESKKFTLSYEDALAYLNMTEEQFQYQKQHCNTNIEGFWCYDIVIYDTDVLLNELLKDHEREIILNKGEEIAKRADEIIEYKAERKTREKYNQLARRIADVLLEQQVLDFGWEKGTKKKG